MTYLIIEGTVSRHSNHIAIYPEPLKPVSWKPIGVQGKTGSRILERGYQLRCFPTKKKHARNIGQNFLIAFTWRGWGSVAGYSRAAIQ